MRHITTTIARLTHISQPLSRETDQTLQLNSGVVSVCRPSSPSGHGVARRRNGYQENEISIYALPPDKETHSLIQHYFSNTGLLFPYIHEESFLKTYAKAKANKFTNVRRTCLGLLNIALALVISTTVHVNHGAERRAALSDVYYQRALGLCDKEITRGTSVEVGKCAFLRYFHVLSQHDSYLSANSQYTISSSWANISKETRSLFRRGQYMGWQSKQLSCQVFTPAMPHLGFQHLILRCARGRGMDVSSLTGKLLIGSWIYSHALLPLMPGP